MRTFTKFSLLKRCTPLLLLLGAMVLGLSGLYAQAGAYSFAQSSSSYTPISGGTLHSTTADDSNFSGVAIGFSFTFNGVAYTTVNINSNGYVTFGATLPNGFEYFPISATTAYAGAAAAFARDLVGGNATSALRSEAIGTAPNRTFVVQYQDWRRYSGGGVAGDLLNFQIRLSETSNVIQFVYGSNTATSTLSLAGQVGLRGAANADFANRSTTNDWSATTAGGSNSASCTTTNTVMPPSSLTFTYTPPVPCAGTPTPGATVSSSPLACPSVAFSLSLSNSMQGAGINYQWQSSPTGSGYTNIAGATNSTYSASQTAATFYQCIVTCTNSGQSTNSTPLLVPMNAPTQCYCTPTYTTGCTLDDRIDLVTFGTLVNPASGTSGCTSGNGLGYTQYLSGLPVPSLVRGSTNPISVLVGDGGTEHVRVFVDWNQDGDFVDASEDQLIGSGNGVTVSGNVVVPADAAFGQTRMRVRVVYNTNVFTSCTSHTWGETEDYLLSVLAPPSCVGLIAPTNNSSACPGATTLSWNAAATATGYDVYFGTTNTPPLVSANQSGTTYNAGNLGLGTYFWKVVPKNAAGDATGCPTWTFSRADAVFPTISGCPAAPLTAGTQAPNCTAAVNFPTLTPNDNCGITSFVQTVGLPSGSAFPLGNNQVRFVATDVAGLTAECIFTVVISDDDAPSITCPATVNVGTAAPNCSAVANYSVTSSDNCSATTVTRLAGLASGSTYPLGTTNHVYRAVDAVGNSSTCSFNVVVSDDDTPNITTCPPSIQLSTNANCEAQLGDYRGLVVSNDNCSTPVISQSPAPNAIVPGFSTVTMIATDAAGNSKTCTFQISAVDGTPPSISCAPEQFINANPATCALAIPNLTSLQNATDNCGNPIVTQSPAPGTTIPYGQSTVTFTATDGPGFTATCTMQVTVVDVTAPVITCPPSVTLGTGTDPNTCTAVATFQCAVAPDNCSGSANPEQTDGLPSGSAFPRGVNVVRFQATDQAGNVASCSFTITVVDDQAPYLACPQNITQNTNPGLCTSVVTWTPVVTSDNCDVPTLVQTAGPTNGSAFPKGTTIVAFRSTDGTGNAANCSFTVTVNDAELPVITCPANIVRSTDFNLCTAVVSYTVTATDNCPGVTLALVSGLASGSAFPKGVTTNVWRATDASGNTSTCSFTVTVNDTQAPTITCPTNIVRSNDPNLCGATVTYTVTATDNCPGVTTTLTGGLASGSFFPVGTTTVTHRATDASGNTSTCSFTVTVNDTQLPVLMCPSSVTVNNAPNQCAGVATWMPIMATDNCPGVVVTFVSGMASGSLFPVGVTTIVYRATDASGNSTTCSWTVTVRDVQKPSITCPPSINKNNDWDKCSAAVPFIGTPIISDNCGIASSTNNAIGTYPVGATVVTFNVTDVNGNTNSCSLTVTVKDYQPPTIKCPANISAYSEAAAACGAKVNYSVTATDNCPGVTVVSTAWPEPEDGYYPIGTTMIMATATDAAGNTSGCMFNIIVIASPEICDGLDNDCDGLVDEDELLGQVANKSEAAGKAGDLFGTAVSIWGDYAVVGAKGENQGAGAAYILKRNVGGQNKWGRISKLLPVLVGAGDAFGTSVAINGDWVIVGAPGEGKAFLFQKDAGGADNWGFVKSLQATGGSADDNFGTSVAISGDYALVGASMDDAKGLNAGAAYVFNKDQGGVGAWGQVAKVTGTDTQAGDLFGTTVDLEGEMAIVGAPLNDEKGMNAGAAYLFDRSSGWQQAKKLTATDAAALDNYGTSVSMSETTVAVGSSQDDDKGSSSGSIYMYEKSVGGAGNWGQLTKLTAIDGSANDQLGYALALSGRYLAAGARFDDPRGFKSGSMYVYYRQDDGVWVQLTKFFEASGESRDYFGSSIGLHKGTIIAGAPGNDFGTVADKGSAAVFAAGCDGNQANEELEVREEPTAIAGELSIRTFPTPFSTVLNIVVEAPAATDARISVWNSLGQEVETVFSGNLEGSTTFQWNAGANQPGAYYLRLQTGDKTEVKPILLVR